MQYLVDHADWYREPPPVELVTVHLPVPQLPGLGSSVGKSQLAAYYREEGETRLAAAKRKLEAASIAYESRVLVGPVAETLVKHAKDKRCDLICLGTRGLSGIAGALLGSTATKVINLSDIPVLVV